MRVWWALLVACSSSPGLVTAPAPTRVPDAAPAPVDASVDAPMAVDAAVAIVEPVTPAFILDPALSVVPPLKGTTKRVEEGKTITLAGVKITMGRANHKHAVGGDSVGMWSFKLAHGGKTLEQELRSSSERFEAEVAAHGQLFVFRIASYTAFDVTAVGKAPKPRSDEACEALIDDKAKAANLPRGNAGSSVEHGFLRRTEAGWEARCGVYSGRVWFTQEDSPLGKVPPVAGALTKVKERETVTIGKTTIEFSGANHKHAVKGPALGMWTFAATQGGKREELELRSSDEGFEAEVVAHGAFFVFRHLSYGEFAIVLAADKAPAPLDQDACVERIRAAAAKAGLPPGNDTGYSTDQGIVTFTARSWRGHCGTLSRRVWFTKQK